MRGRSYTKSILTNLNHLNHLNQSRQKEIGTRLKDRNGDYKNCECLEQFKEYPKNIRMTARNFTVSAKKKKDANDENDDLIDLDEDEANEWEEMHIETEASKYIEEGDFAVIKTCDEHAYYLLKLTSYPYETESKSLMITSTRFLPSTVLWKGII